MKLTAWLFSLIASLGAAPREQPLTAVRLDPRRDRLELFLRDETGKPFHTLPRLAAWLAARGRQLRLGMNAGMYEPDFSPVGLLVIDGKEIAPLNLREGRGNFYLKPNGVFLLGAAGAQIVEASAYPSVAAGVRLATQSGPLLLQQGRVHPQLDPQSTSRHVRNGVGICGGEVVFAISPQKLSLYEFARRLRDELGCETALYLDGSVSSLYSPALGRSDARHRLGPLLGVVDAKDSAQQ